MGPQLSDGQLSVLNDYDAPLDDDNNGVVVEEIDERDGAPGSPAAAQGG